MGQATLATVDAILKEVYGPRIEDQLQTELIALKRIERTSDGVTETVGGKYVDFPIRVKRNSGIGNRKENEALPTAGQQGYAEVHVPLQYAYARGRLTAQVMNLAEKNHQAFASAMDNEMEWIKQDALKDCARQVYGDGTGNLSSLTATTTSANTVTVASTQYLEVGMIVDVRTRSNGAALAAAREITAINRDTKVVTLDGAAFSASATDALYREGNFAGGNAREVSGFETIISDTTALHGLSPASQEKWKAVVKGNGGTNRALSEGLMIETCDDVRINGGKVSAIFTSLGVRRAYFNLLTQQRRYADTKTFAGGFQGLAFNYGTEIPVVEDVDCPANRMYFLDEDKFKVYRNKEWHFADEDGNVLKWVNGFDAFEFYLRQFWEIGVNQRNANAKLADITEG